MNFYLICWFLWNRKINIYHLLLLKCSDHQIYNKYVMIHYFSILVRSKTIQISVGCYMFFDFIIIFFLDYSVFVLLLLVFQKLYNKFLNLLFGLHLNDKYQLLNLYYLILHKAFPLQNNHYFMILIDCLIKDYY